MTILMKGSKAATRADVYAVATPAATGTWTPVSHQDAVELTLTKLAGLGYSVAHEQHGLARDGAEYTGLFTLEKDGKAEGGDEWGTMFGLRNSHNQRWALRYGIGQKVFICDNGAFVAERVVNRKHTVNIWLDLPALADRALAKLVDEVNEMRLRTEVFKSVDLDGRGRDVYAMIALAVHNGIIPGSKLSAVVDEFAKPSYAAFEPRNLWSLYNAFTQHMKGLPPATLIDRTKLLTKAFDHIGQRMLLSQVERKMHSQVIEAITKAGVVDLPGSVAGTINLQTGEIKHSRQEEGASAEAESKLRFPRGFTLPGVEVPRFGGQSDPGQN